MQKQSGLWRKKFNQWTANRFTPGREHHIGYRQIFVFPNRYGLLMAITLLAILIGAANYQNNLAYMITFWLMSLGIVCIFHTYKNLVNLTIKIKAIEPVYQGEDFCFEVYMTDAKGKSHYALDLLWLNSQASAGFAMHGHATAKLKTQTQQRGRMELPRITIQTQYPIPLLRAWTYCYFAEQAWVYPKPIKPNSMHWLGMQGDGLQQKNKQIGEEFAGIRDYQAGDTMSRIYWKAVAKEKGMVSKFLQTSSGDPQALHWDMFAGIDLETRISYLSYCCLQAWQSNKPFSLHLPNQIIAMGDSEQHFHQAMQALALFQTTSKQESQHSSITKKAKVTT